MERKPFVSSPKGCGIKGGNESAKKNPMRGKSSAHACRAKMNCGSDFQTTHLVGLS